MRMVTGQSNPPLFWYPGGLNCIMSRNSRRWGLATNRNMSLTNRGRQTSKTEMHDSDRVRSPHQRRGWELPCRKSSGRAIRTAIWTSFIEQAQDSGLNSFYFFRNWCNNKSKTGDSNLKAHLCTTGCSGHKAASFCNTGKNILYKLDFKDD